MFRSLKVASLAAISCLAVAGIGGSVAAPAFGAAGADGTSLILPASVVEAASAEAQSATEYNFIPESNAAEPESQGTASSLAALVADNLRTETQDREEECLAAATYFEARSEPLEGQLAVANVILNRAKSGRFPSSMCGVVFQPSQFSFVRGKGFPAIARNSRDWREAVAIARVAREGLWEAPVSNALFFHARRVSPRWRLARVGAVGDHIFYR